MSKYANLSDIDDQPEVYETSDDIKQAQHYSEHNDDDQFSEDGDNENLVRTRLSHQEASALFKNSVVESNNTDFSDRLTRRKKAMYRTYVRRPLEANAYDILPKELVLEETRLQKFRRLTFEVQELGNALNNDKNNEDDSHLVSQITLLQNELGRLQQRITNTDQPLLDHEDPTFVSATTYGKRIDEAKALIKQLETYNSMATSPLPVADSSTANETGIKDGKLVTYELYYTPETINADKQGNAANVDERIANIEKLVGTSTGHDFDSIPTNLTSTSLLHSLSKLEQQITLVSQPRHLDTVTRRVNVLNSELDRLHELKSGGYGGGRRELGYPSSNLHESTSTIPSGSASGESSREEQHGLSNDTEEKVTRLFTILEKVDPLLNLTPALLARLKALHGLHTEAATFGQSVEVISEEQTRMTKEIKNLDAACELLTKSLKENDDMINKNVSVIDTQMADLVRRMETLAATASISTHS